jgi:hypothetical protein
MRAVVKKVLQPIKGLMNTAKMSEILKGVKGEVFCYQSSRQDYWDKWFEISTFSEYLSERISNQPKQDKSFYEVYNEFLMLLKAAMEYTTDGKEIYFLLIEKEGKKVSHPVLGFNGEDCAYAFSFYADINFENEHEATDQIATYPHDYSDVWKIVNLPQS